MSADDERNKISGGCACGEIRFGFYEPVVVQAACHCRACQYAAGGGPAYVVGVRRDQFRVTRGHPLEFATLADSGNLVTRVFCGTCGTHVYAFNDRAPDTCSVKVGALDDPSRFRPRLQIWTSEAQPWHHKYWFAARFRRNPPGLFANSGRIDAAAAGAAED
jgi:hypothetical protein